MSEKLWAVVPAKRLAFAKQRLANALGADRERFARRLAEQTVDTLLRSGVLAGVLVVTADPLIAADARGLGAKVVKDSAESLNEACGLGLAAARRRRARSC